MSKTTQVDFDRFLGAIGLSPAEFTKPDSTELEALKDGTLEGEHRFQEAMVRYHGQPGRSPCYCPAMLPIAEAYYRRALDGDPEGLTNLILLLNYDRGNIAWGVYRLYLKGCLSRRMLGRALGDVYTDGKVFGALREAGYKPKQIAEMFDAASPEDVMGKDDYSVFLELPDVVQIFRGTAGQTPKGVRYGMSWTRNREVAEKFASWHQTDQIKPAQVWSGSVKRSDILAYFDARGEDEIVVRPGRVFGVRTETVGWAMAA